MDDAGHISSAQELLPHEEEYDLVEIDIPPAGECRDDSCLNRRPAKPRQAPVPLPRWRYLDLDEVLPDPAIEAALRAAGIDRIRRPSRGFLAASGIRSLAMIEPIHVMRRCDRWYCLVGWDLLKEAQEILQAPRIFPVCVHDAVTPEDMRGYILSEQIALPVRHQMSSDALTGFIGTLLDVTRKNTSHFLRLKAGQWVSFIGRSLRWLRSYTTTWEKRANHG